jgi:hypothetical protein
MNDFGEAPVNDAPLPDDPRGMTITRANGDGAGIGLELASSALVGSVARMESGTVALTAQVEARIRASYFLAKQFPRNWIDVGSKLKRAFLRPVLAEGALYSKPIGGSKIEGLSIRFAEEAFRTMGNLSVETMLISDDDEKRVYTVLGMDLETNASIPVSVVVTKQMERSTVKQGDEVLAKRLNSQGRVTYVIKARSEDDYRSKEQSALQKARRDVILFLTPGDIKEECEQVIRKTLADRDARDPQEQITKLAAAYYGVGVSAAELEKLLGHPLAVTNASEIQMFRSFYTALKDGEATWPQIVDAWKGGTNTGADAGKTAPPAEGKGATSALAAKLAKKDVAKDVAKDAAAIEKRHLELTGKARLSVDEQEELRNLVLDYPTLAK